MIVFSWLMYSYTWLMWWCRCRKIAEEFLSEGNGQSQHTVHAMGHCHIDSGIYIM